MHERTYTLSDFYFDLPEELIAQYPLQQRDESRLFVIHRESGLFEHRIFRDITEYFHRGDTLVFNDARVMKARIFFFRQSGARIEVVLTRRKSDHEWLILTNRTKRLRAGEVISACKDNKIKFHIQGRHNEYLIARSNIELTEDVITSIGEMPLPPYIKRAAEEIDDDRYQTVYASRYGSAAAPTAGLHFTPELLRKLADKDVGNVTVTLNVSWGTFQPVRTEDLSQHTMHTESYSISKEAALSINAARDEKRRIIAVGTTSLRVLESSYDRGITKLGPDETNLFIRPPCNIRSTQALVTNFHTPFSTLLMLVAAFAGYDTIMKAYNEAVRLQYRFFSYGDAMLIV